MADLICGSGELPEHIDSLAGEPGWTIHKTEMGGRVEGGGKTLEIVLRRGDGLKAPFEYKTVQGVWMNGLVRVPNVAVAEPRKPAKGKKAKD